MVIKSLGKVSRVNKTHDTKEVDNGDERRFQGYREWTPKGGSEIEFVNKDLKEFHEIGRTRRLSRLNCEPDQLNMCAKQRFNQQREELLSFRGDEVANAAQFARRNRDIIETDS